MCPPRYVFCLPSLAPRALCAPVKDTSCPAGAFFVSSAACVLPGPSCNKHFMYPCEGHFVPRGGVFLRPFRGGRRAAFERNSYAKTVQKTQISFCFIAGAGRAFGPFRPFFFGCSLPAPKESLPARRPGKKQIKMHPDRTRRSGRPEPGVSRSFWPGPPLAFQKQI